MSAAKAKKPATRRQNAGKGHRYFLDGEPCPGVTTIIGDGVPKPALINWASRVTAGYAVDHWDELAAKAVSVRLKELEGARYATTNEAAVRGTDVHALAHKLALGEEVEVPEPLVGHVDAALAFLNDFDVTEELSEVVVVKRAPWGSYMGSFDLLATLGARNGERWLLDWKTTGSGIFPEVALQLAAYADADSYLDPDGLELPMPKADRLGAVWLRADGYDLIPCDVCPPDELEPRLVFAYAAQVARFINAERGTYVGSAIAPPRLEEAPE